MARSRACLAKLKDTSVQPPPFENAQTLMDELSELIMNMDDPNKLEELLGVNDDLRAAVDARKRPALTLNLRANGHAVSEDVLATPRSDKGKGRAEVVYDKVLSPTSALLNAGLERDAEGDVNSPTEQPVLGLGLGEIDASSPTDR